MYRPGGSGPRARGSILGALKASEMLDARARLPAEIMVTILNYLPVADQMRAARVCRRFQEMVYDDTRWVSRLKSMGCWDEREARQRFEESLRRRREAAAAAAAAAGQSTDGTGRTHAVSSATIFDATIEQQRRQRPMSELRDGFETMAIGASDPAEDPAAYLDVFKRVRSIRGGARQEYGKIYKALAPFYFDLVKAKSHTDPIVFKAFIDPEQQAQMLANLHRFAGSDWAEGWAVRDAKLNTMMNIFEAAVLREFEQGYEFWDVDGRMRRYAHVLHTLNGAKTGIELFLQKHPLFNDRELMHNPMDCLNQAPTDDVTLEPSRRFFEHVLLKVNEQAGILERIFPNPGIVFWGLAEKVAEDIIAEYTTPMFDEAHERSILSYLKAVSGIFEQTMRFFESLTPPKGSENEDLTERAKQLTLKVFEPHLDLYLQEELDYFTKQAEIEVSQWEKKLSEQDSSLESFYMSNINRSAEKNDFLSSFKKVIMMPVTVLPNFPIGSPFATTKPTSSPAVTANGSAALTPQTSRPQTPGLGGNEVQGRGSSPLPGAKAPTDELAAKAAIIASKLEGIKSLFSIEVALDLVHKAKGSLGRAAVLIPLGGQVGGEAREQCANIFIALVRILGQRHVKLGFDMAVDHLSHYNPREVSDHDQKGVAPLVMFIELVNVGDLISQMIDVFYEQQLVTPKISDKNDFLDPAGLAKKKFEQMLDESVAAGLNKGIDVLMDEVEYLQGTLQLPTDYNPTPRIPGDDVNNRLSKRATVGSMAELDIGPTQTARRIVELVRSHTNMLVGTTEKSMLDVFNGEVGQRLFTAICKHLKRQRISTDGAVKLIADMNLYSDYVRSLRNQDVLPYFGALRELSQIYLIDPGHAKEMATVIADGDRFGGVFRAEEVYEYAQRRADWYQVRRSVERAMYGMDCVAM
ncbi:exocyst complex component Sec10-like protein [Trichoderma gracile]